MGPPCVIGVDLGGTKLLAGTVDRELNVHHRAHRTAPGGDRAAVLDRVVDAVQEAIAAAPGEVRAVGFGIPSLIDRERGIAVSTVHLPIADLPFRDIMAERLGLPVVVDNDANVAMLAEHRLGAASGARHAVLLTIGTGIGSGVVVDGQLVRGAVGAATELGHMVIDMDGPRCHGTCPNRGCLEALVSGTALGEAGLRVAREDPSGGLAAAKGSGRAMTGALVTELAHDGDPGALACLRTAGLALGVGLANIVNIFNPEVIVIGGGVIAAGDLLLDPAREEMRARALSPSRDIVRVVPARFGAESGMLGAAVLAFMELHS
ncbi:ROK family protein [Paraconexibacter antarcticus]|uniref:ROK family protein n=1 Tax=Paraconexibacter antarcticus TaxID=2949664 RepID=A0ABY5DN56_9ACTN|nr:ROK family protein [Paraconexibacter antarcticus]UTI63455.1 ROK family protein [Paraconexibacter antarcticus]